MHDRRRHRRAQNMYGSSSSSSAAAAAGTAAASTAARNDKSPAACTSLPLPPGLPDKVRDRIEIEANSASVRRIRNGCVVPAVGCVKDSVGFVRREILNNKNNGSTVSADGAGSYGGSASSAGKVGLVGLVDLLVVAEETALGNGCRCNGAAAVLGKGGGLHQMLPGHMQPGHMSEANKIGIVRATASVPTRGRCCRTTTTTTTKIHMALPVVPVLPAARTVQVVPAKAVLPDPSRRRACPRRSDVGGLLVLP